MSKVTINPALLAALDHYAGYGYNALQPTMFVHTSVNDRGHGHKSAWPVERACAMAHEVLSSEELNLLKLEELKRGLKAYDCADLYEKIMGEKLVLP